MSWQNEIDELRRRKEIIDPRDSRRLLCEFANLTTSRRKHGPRSFGFRP